MEQQWVVSTEVRGDEQKVRGEKYKHEGWEDQACRVIADIKSWESRSQVWDYSPEK